MTISINIEDVFPKWSKILYMNKQVGFDWGAPGTVVGYYKGKVKIRLDSDRPWNGPRVIQPRFLFIPRI